LVLINSPIKRCIVTLNGVIYVLDLTLKSNGSSQLLLSVLVATNIACMFEFPRACDKLWTPEGQPFGMVKAT